MTITVGRSARLLCTALLALTALLSADLIAAEWSIPLAGNTFPTSRTATGRFHRGEVLLKDTQDTYAVFFKVDRPAKLTLSLVGYAKNGRVDVLGRVSESNLKKESNLKTSIAGDRQTKHLLGEVDLTKSGYARLDLDATGGSVALSELVVESETEGLQIDYVRNNDGNMFYWGRRGPSVHLRYEVPQKLDLSYGYSEITVPPGQDPVGSYFMANGFGEGYFGFQVNSATERRVLFSVWSPFKTDNPRDIPADQRITNLAHGAGVHVGKFGNEGSGGQSYLVYPWKAGTTYRFLTHIKPDGKGNTVYTSWFGDKSADQWQLIASFRRPQTNKHYTGFHSFLESFSPTFGHIERSASYGNVWVCDTEGRWHECTRARFSVDATGGKRQRLDFAGGAKGAHFFMRNCGFFNETVKPGTTFTRKSTAGDRPNIEFEKLPRR